MNLSLQKEFDDGIASIEQTVALPERLLEVFRGYLQKIRAFELTRIDSNKLEIFDESIRNIDQAQFKNNFSHIYNQACILTCALLEATLKKAFDSYFCDPTDLSKMSDRAKELKVTLGEFISSYANENPGEVEESWEIGKLIRKKDNSINFQDMQSILRSFESYCGRTLNLSKHTIEASIFYLECRHSLVHSAGIADPKFIKGIERLKDSFTNRFRQGERIILDQRDWPTIAEQFKKVVTEAAHPNAV